MVWLPLTAAQRGLYFAHQLAPENPCYTTAEVVELDGSPDPGRLAGAISAAYAEFEQLRAVFRLGADGPEQRILDEPTATLELVEVASETEAEAWLQEDLGRPMELAESAVRTALLRLPDGRSWWYHAAHHVVLDGYGVQQLMHRVAELYRGAEATSSRTTLAEVVAADPQDEAAADWWEERLRGMYGVVALAGRTAAPSPRATKRSRVLSQEEHGAIAAGARRLGVGWTDLVLAALGGYVGRLVGRSDTRVGLPLMNRSLPGVGTLPTGHTVCTAMNVLPLTVPADGTVGSAVTATAEAQRELREHPFLRQEELARRLHRLRSDAQLFGAQINLVPFELALDLGDARGTVRNLTAGPVEDLTLCLRGTPGRRHPVRLEIDANPTLYAEADVDLHLERVAAWLAAYCAAGLETAVSDLPLLTAREHELVTRGFNDTTVVSSPSTLAERFVAQAERTPEATALVFGAEQRTYAELHEAARRVAAGLQAEGVRAGEVVGVAMERGFALYEAIHGVALAGAVYLPLDLDLPTARREGMQEDAAAVRVITSATMPHGTQEVTLPADPSAPAYLLFTSGSTGRPKGVLVGQAAIDNRLAWMQHHLPVGPGDRVLHKTPISFDVSVWELFWPLQVGAAVVIAEPGAHRDPRALAGLIADGGVTTLHFVPSMLRAFLSDRTARARVKATVGGVRHVVTSGEALTPDLVASCAEWFGVAPTNLYGPTEAAVDVTVHDCVAGEEPVPIGRPIWNTSCYVLDEALRPVPIGVPGELWLGGVQLAQGYVGRPELTAERFVDTDFGRLYRTGDRASWRPDGELHYLGRGDDQVKIRGQRVELGEIEAALAGTPGVEAVAAGVVGERLVLWYVAGERADPASCEGSLRSAAAALLPAAFVPQHWIAVPEVPMGTSGKTDRKALAASWPPDAGSTVGGASPRGLLEERLCRLVGEVLATVAGPDDDFFALGGDSLSVLRLVAAVSEETGHDVVLGDVFAAPTPALLAERLGSREGVQGDTGELLTLRPGTTARPPLFLLPPAGGLGWCYAGLLRTLPADLGVYAIQAAGLVDGDPATATDLDELAAQQLATIRAVVGGGTFHVAGWSLGGMAAHAVAALARGEGQPVGAVVLLDAYPSDQWRHLAEPSEAEALVGVLRLGGVEPPDGPLDRDRAVSLLQESGSAVGRLPEQVLRGCLRSVMAATRIVRGSRHRRLEGDITVVVAGAPRKETWVDASGWAVHTTGEVRTVTLDVTHGDLVRRPAVDDVGTILAAAVEPD